MTLADGTEIHEGDKVTIDPTMLEQTGSEDARPVNGREGIVTHLDEEDMVITVNLDGTDVMVQPDAIIDVDTFVRKR